MKNSTFNPGMLTMSRTGIGLLPSGRGGRGGPGGRIRAQTKTAAAKPKPIVNRNCVGGMLADPPAQPTIEGPNPWPTALATM